MNKFLPLVLFITLVLLTSTIAGNVYADKTQSKIVKSIKKDAGSFKKVCEVWINSTGNNVLHKVYEKANSPKCSSVSPPPVPVNKPPVVIVDSPIKCLFDKDCQIAAEVSDPDGNITNIIWNQESGPQVNFTVLDGSFSILFHPLVNDTFVFSVEAQDNNGSATLKPITVNVGQVVDPPVQCPAGQHEENGKCVEDPKPQTNTTNVILVGDFGGTSVTSAAAKANPELFVALGDLFYGSDLAKYNSGIKTVFGDSGKCVIGNHDSNEDGSGSIIAQALKECKELWSREVANNSTVVIGFNSNGNINSQINGMKNINVSDSVKNVVVVSHKPCETSPKSHHPVSQAPDVVKFCDAVKDRFSGKNIVLISGHNHQMAGTADGKIFVSGAGGRSHYVCSTDSKWTFCDNQKYGYLELLINNNNGDMTSRFVDTNGQVLKSWG